MSSKKVDWLTGKTLAEQNAMFGNIFNKIDGYEETYGLLAAWKEEVKTWCLLYTTIYSAVMQNRATESQMNQWFKNILEGKFSDTPVSNPPVFRQITVPEGAKTGLYVRFRKLIGQFKSNDAYTHADGEDLMIVAPQEGERDYRDVFPELKNSLDLNGNIISRYTRGEFGGVEEQYREFGESVWQHADKTSENVVVFKPSLSTPNSPVRVELRAVFIIKNKRVGKWSPIYSVTVG